MYTPVPKAIKNKKEEMFSGIILESKKTAIAIVPDAIQTFNVVAKFDIE